MSTWIYSAILYASGKESLTFWLSGYKLYWLSPLTGFPWRWRRGFTKSVAGITWRALRSRDWVSWHHVFTVHPAIYMRTKEWKHHSELHYFAFIGGVKFYWYIFKHFLLFCFSLSVSYGKVETLCSFLNLTFLVLVLVVEAWILHLLSCQF